LSEDRNGDGFLDIPTGGQQNVLGKFDYNSGRKFEWQFGGGYLNDNRAGGQQKQFIKNYSDSLPLYKLNIDNTKWEVYSKSGFVFPKKQGTSMGLQLS
jgi:hypothetical protein